MSLPGKITLCELEEDNPQRSYFRIKPVLTLEDGQAVDATGIQAEYGDEGGIRIVPDKNDAMRFKSRMRTLGGYCLLDLTAHPGENEKIRPNKNYSQQNGEFNRNIVYSDVIRACGDLEVMQVFRSAESGKGRQALTAKVLLQDAHGLRGPYIPELTPDRVIYEFAADQFNEPRDFEQEDIITLRRGGEEVELYVSAALKNRHKSVVPAASESAEQKAARLEQAYMPLPVPVANAQPPVQKDSAAANPVAEEALPAKAESAPAPADRQPAMNAPAKPAAPEARAPESAPDHRPANEPAPRRHTRNEVAEEEELPERAGAHGAEGMLGLNPRRGRSLSEIVDYRWRQSRLEHLGAAVSGGAASSPLTSPVERAKQAISEAWLIPEGRQALIRELAKLENIESLLSVNTPVTSGKVKSEEELNRLEAEKLELLHDIDKLKSDRIRQRSELMEETRTAHAKEIAELEKREQQLKDECVSRERAAQSARQAQAEAEKLFNREAKLKLDTEFLKFAMFTKAAALLKSEENIDVDEFTGTPSVCEPTGAQMISDLRRAFEAGGRELSNDEALNYLACLAIGSVVIFSGPTGCGKSYTAHALAGALGLRQKGAWRFVRLESDNEDVKKSVGFREQLKLNDGLTQRFMLLEDINMKEVPDQSRGLMGFADEARQQGITLMMTCLDDQIGYPLQSRLLDRAFFIRLRLPEGNTWRGAMTIPDADKAPSLESVRRVFLSPGDVPAEIKSRMELLLQRLGEVGVRITPRALSDMYQYCAAVCPLMTEDKLNALDRAVAQRALPHILATARSEALKKLPEILVDLPRSLQLLSEPIALPPV